MLLDNVSTHDGFVSSDFTEISEMKHVGFFINFGD